MSHGSSVHRLRPGALSLALSLLSALGCGGGSGAGSSASEPSDAAPSTANYLSFAPVDDSFPLVEARAATPLVVSDDDWPGVVRAVGDLQADIARVTNLQPTVSSAVPRGARRVVLVGTLGKSKLIDALVAARRINLSYLRTGKAAKWETFLIETVQRPLPGVEEALVIAGSDKRGTIFGVYDVSRRIGVSPWYWWDDVPVRPQSALHVLAGRWSAGTPAVKYRGFFINDESPSTTNWSQRIFGDAPGTAPGQAPGAARALARGDTPKGHVNPGALNHLYYDKIYELMLRLRGNYLWSAEWGKSLWIDDFQSAVDADTYGVILGSPHDAPMQTSTDEFSWFATNYNPAITEWNPLSWVKHSTELTQFWSDAIERSKNFEIITSMGIRGQNDSRNPDDSTKTEAELIQDKLAVIAAQQQILADKGIPNTPQSWDLYKEVQRFWSDGMRPPENVTIMFCDDNWGNMRSLPDPAEPRAGGYGIYYHLDYVGGPRSYKWVDNTLLANMWEQLHLTIARGADRMWMVNVGDVKGDEVPIQFFLDYAWAPQALPAEAIPEWEAEWAALHFGWENADAVASILHEYASLQSIRKPEATNLKTSLLHLTDPGLPLGDYYTDPAHAINSPDVTYSTESPYSLVHYRELELLARRWAALAAKTDDVALALPADQQDAYFELVSYKVKATANLYALRLAEYQNILWAGQGRTSANDAMAAALARFDDAMALEDMYNYVVAGGKWLGWATQPYIGWGDCARPGVFTGSGTYAADDATWNPGKRCVWQMPEADDKALPDELFPFVSAVIPADGPSPAVAIDGSTLTWPGASTPGVLPTFDRYQTQPTQYVDVFNRGSGSFTFTAASPLTDKVNTTNKRTAFPLVLIDPPAGTIDATTRQLRLQVTIDWPRVTGNFAPDLASLRDVPIVITPSVGDPITVYANIDPAYLPAADWRPDLFVEANGVVSMEADHYNRVVSTAAASFVRVPDIGRLGDGMMPMPVDAPRQTPGGQSPRLEYDFYLFDAVPTVNVHAYVSPRTNTIPRPDLGPPDAGGRHQIDRSLKYAISIDDGAPQLVDITVNDDLDGGGNNVWGWKVMNNVNLTFTKHALATGAGRHTLKLWMVDPTVIVQKLVVDAGGAQESYLGPPESYRTQMDPD